jgi:heat shock protein HslJ
LGLAAVFAMVLAAGCGDDGDGTSGTGRSTSGTAVTRQSLDGRAFVSTEVEGRELAVDSEVGIAFDGPRMIATAGCNTMSGNYSITDGALTFDGPLMSTMMGCDDDLMAQEQWLNELLESSPTISGTSDGIVLRQGGTTIVMVDKTIAEPDRPLVGTQWQLETIVDGELASSVPAGVRVPTLEIISEDQVVFFDGCNQGGANVEVSGSTLSFELASTTLAQCEPNADRVEQAVLAVLDGDVTFVIEGNQLTLTKGEQGLVYRAA